MKPVKHLQDPCRGSQPQRKFGEHPPINGQRIPAADGPANADLRREYQRIIVGEDVERRHNEE